MKLIKFLFKIILVVVVLVGVSVGVVFYQLNDNTFEEPEYLKNVEPLKLEMNSLVSKGIKDSEESGKMTISLDEKEISILLKTLSNDLNKQLKESKITIETMYVDIIHSNDIKFICFLDFSGFKTSLTGEFLLNLNNNNFEITIDNIKLGKMNFQKSMITSLINYIIKDENLQKELKLAGINIDLDLKTISMKLDLLEVKDLLIESLKDTVEYDLYQTILDVVFRVDNLISLCSLENELGIDLNINDFSFNENQDIKNPYVIDFASVNTKIETLLNNNVIEENLASSVATYLVKGYINSPDNIKEEIKDVDLSSIGISNKELYFGIINYNSNEIKDIFIEQAVDFNMLNPLSFEGFKLSEEAWNNYFAQEEAVGKFFSFIRKENNQYKSSYLAIDGLYIDIKDDHLAFYLLVSINGKKLTINFELDAKGSQGLKISSIVESMRFGNDLLLDEEIKSVLKYLDNTIKDEWIVIDFENKKIEFDFTSMFTDNEVLRSFINSDLFDLETSFNEKNGKGYTLISLKSSI